MSLFARVVLLLVACCCVSVAALQPAHYAEQQPLTMADAVPQHSDAFVFAEEVEDLHAALAELSSSISSSIGLKKLTEVTLANATGMSATEAKEWLPHIDAAFKKYDINNAKRMGQYLGHCGHESGSFKTLVENLNYSAERLLEIWPKRFTAAEAKSYARQPQKIANKAYANRMGNGDEKSGDGWKYRGRGLIQITGKDMYTVVGKALGLDLVKTPELLEQKKYAALSAGWYFKKNGLLELADQNMFTKITEIINGGQNGIEDRRTRYRQAFYALE